MLYFILIAFSPYSLETIVAVIGCIHTTNRHVVRCRCAVVKKISTGTKVSRIFSNIVISRLLQDDPITSIPPYVTSLKAG